MAERPHRLFVAVPVPPGPLDDVMALVDGVRDGPLGTVPRWVHLPNLHLTVRFLGDTPADLVPDVAAAVRDAVGGHAAFDVVIAGAGSFPPRGKPRTMWLGIAQGADELGAMAAAVDHALEPLGWPPDPRPYRPHLTVARLDAASRLEGATVAELLEDAAREWRTAFRADRVILYSSHLGGGPPRHDAVLEVRLPG